MSSNLEKLAREIDREGKRQGNPDWVKSADALTLMANSLPLPSSVEITEERTLEEVREELGKLKGIGPSDIDQNYLIIPKDTIDPNILAVLELRSKNRKSKLSHIPSGQPIASFLFRMGLIDGDNRGRPRASGQKRISQSKVDTSQNVGEQAWNWKKISQ